MNDQTEVGRLFVSSEDRSFTPPTVTPPQGQHFAGWATREQSGDSVTMTVRFQPGEDGSVRLPENHALDPMTLYAAFVPDNLFPNLGGGPLNGPAAFDSAPPIRPQQEN